MVSRRSCTRCSFDWPRQRPPSLPRCVNLRYTLVPGWNTPRSRMAPRTPTEVFGPRVAEVRKRRAWTQNQLATRLTQNGFPTDRASVAKIETRGRGVSLSHVIAYALALGVAPVSLVLPVTDEDVELAPGVVTNATSARSWAIGSKPLGHDGTMQDF